MCESGTQESFFVTVICESVTVSETLTEAESSIVISSGSRESWNPLNKRIPRLFLLLLTAITLFHIVLLLDSFSLRHRDYFS